MNQNLRNRLSNASEESIKEILDNGISPSNLDVLSKLVDICKDVVKMGLVPKEIT